MGQSTLGIAGAGRMGAALLQGWLNAQPDFDKQVTVFEPHLNPEIQPVLQALAAQLNPDPNKAAPLDTLVLAIKPQTFASAAKDLKPFVGPTTLVVSIMAGVTSNAIASALNASRVVRAMPNTPGAIGLGITGYVANDLCAADCTSVEDLLAPLGLVERIPTEAAIDAVTGVSGSGPAYVFLLVEAMAAAGEAQGLDKGLAMRLARQTVIGAGALLATSPDQSAEALRKAVTSPGGTTAAALAVLTEAEAGLPTLMQRAISAATARAAELGN